MTDEALTAERLRQVLHYNPDTGIFVRIKSSGGVLAGTIAGCKNTHGYLEIRVDRKLYLAHRLAWLYVYGKWPTGLIDHRNHSKTANFILNLRDVTHAVNLQNQKGARIDSIIGVLGVTRKGQKFTSEITINGTRKYLGMFDTIEDAHRAYLSARVV